MRPETMKAALAAALVIAAPALASPIADNTAFYAFGDSLTDTGTVFQLSGLPPSPPYFQGRFSGGPIWADIVGGHFTAEGKEVRNYAIGGAEALEAGSDDLAAQLGRFARDLGTGALDPGSNPLAAFWIGANDLFGAIGGPSALEVARQAAQALGSAAATLRPVVDELVLFNLPDLARIPLYSGTPLASAATAAAAAFNAALAEQAVALRDLGFEVREIDIAGLVERALANPAAWGLTNVTDPCVVTAPGYQVIDFCGDLPGVDPDSYLFFDRFHPGAHAHAEIAAAVANISLPGALPALIGALCGLAMVARRRA